MICDTFDKSYQYDTILFRRSRIVTHCHHLHLVVLFGPGNGSSMPTNVVLVLVVVGVVTIRFAIC